MSNKKCGQDRTDRKPVSSTITLGAIKIKPFRRDDSITSCVITHTIIYVTLFYCKCYYHIMWYKCVRIMPVYIIYFIVLYFIYKTYSGDARQSPTQANRVQNDNYNDYVFFNFNNYRRRTGVLSVRVNFCEFFSDKPVIRQRTDGARRCPVINPKTKHGETSSFYVSVHSLHDRMYTQL